MILRTVVTWYCYDGVLHIDELMAKIIELLFTSNRWFIVVML